MVSRFLLLLPLALFLTSCARVELATHLVKQLPIPASDHETGVFKIGRPYIVQGKRYYPEETYSYSQTGVASWYGPNFHGKKTANGEVFDKYALTAAHKTLQMPSIIRVTNLQNNRSLIVRVNDRGPFSKNRILDLSERSAEVLGFKNQGTTRVRIDVLTDESRKVAQLAMDGQSTVNYETALNAGQKAPVKRVQTAAYKPMPGFERPDVPNTALAQSIHATTKPASVSPVESSPSQDSKPKPPAHIPNAIYVQAGSFQNQDSAIRYAQRLRPYGQANVYPAMVRGQQFYRVRFGPLETYWDAEQITDKLFRANMGEPIIVHQ